MNLEPVLDFFANFFGRIFIVLNTHGHYPKLFGNYISLYGLLISFFIISCFVNVWWKGVKG